MNLEIYINNTLVDINDDVKVILEKVVSEFRNPNKKTGTFSYTIKLPVTAKNKTIFNFETELYTINKFRNTYVCRVVIDSMEVISGEFKLSDIQPYKSINGVVYGMYANRLADIIPDKTLKDINSFTPINFTGNYTVWDNLDKPLSALNSEIAFPFVIDSFARLKYLNGGYIDGTQYRLSFLNFGVSHFVKRIFQNIFTDAGYTLEGSVLNDKTFNKLIMLYTNDSDELPYNYAELNKMSAYGYYHRSKTIDTPTAAVETNDYKLYVVEPEFRDIYSIWDSSIVYGKTGDLAFAMNNEGTYTCNFTSNYTISIKTDISVLHVAGSTIPAKQYLLFREITNEEVSDGDYKNYPYASIDFNKVKDYDTLNTTTTVEGSALRTTLTTKLVAGRQYKAQVYVFIENTQNVDNLVLNAIESNTWFTISDVEGKKQLEPQRFLPAIKQTDFVQDVFKLFNLYYQIDNDNSKITLYTRDEWFTLNKNNILDLTKNVDLEDFTFKPLTTSDIAETYYKWATDESDYILNNTNYMEYVNANVPEEAPELNFSPLGFLKVKYSYLDGSSNKVYGYDLLPAAIPSTDSVDSTVLDDYEASSNFSYKPKLAIYEGNGGDYINKLTISIEDFGLQYSYFNITLFTPFKHLPKLTFFDIRNQPAYEIETISATREFKLNEASNVNIYTQNDLNFITSVVKVDELDNVSLALSGSKTLFQKLYTNDLVITNFSHYLEGIIKINPVLYNNLNGRNIIRIEDDLYLLESIKNYEVGGDYAKIMIYKFLSS